ncbi:plasminogen-like isoform X3 [Ciona intestinalis]
MAGTVKFMFFATLFAALEMPADSTLEQKDIVGFCENIKDCDVCVYDYEIEFVQGCAVCKCTSPIAREQRMATWKRWERWSECDRSCNFGTRTRVRRCRNGVVGGIGCIGPVFQNRRCRNKRCPLYPGGECYDDTMPTEYRGKVSTAQPGLRCFRWNHQRSAYRPAAYPDSGLIGRYCRNPDGDPSGPWCYTNRLYTMLATCSLPMCKTEQDAYWSNWAGWSSCSESCGTGVQVRIRQCKGGYITEGSCNGPVRQMRACEVEDCTTTTTAPPTTTTTTTTTATTTTTPMPTTLSTTTTTSINAEYECVVNPRPTNYRGNISTTYHGMPCLPWNDPAIKTFNPTNFPDDDLVSNYCRNPDGDLWPWCYYEFDAINGHKWTYCDVPECPPEPFVVPDLGCYDIEDPGSYLGSGSTTLTGYQCQYWDANTPNAHIYHSYRHPDFAELGHHNFCRSPSGDFKPWCFSTNPDFRWEYCDLEVCPSLSTTTIPPTTTTISTTTIGPPITTTRPTTTRPTTTETSSTTTMSSTASTTTIGPPVTTQSTTTGSSTVNPEVCGKPAFPIILNNNNKNQRIVGGFDANKGSLPWMVALRRYPSFSFFCGGSIIDKNWILTAAHCVKNKPESYRGILGNYFNKMVDEEETIVGFSSVHIHENYNDNTLDNDIALLKVAEPLVFNDHVKPVCLPEYNAGVSYVPDTDVIISGWWTLKSNGALSNALQQAYVDIVSLEECGTRYSSVFAPSVMCAGILDKGGIDTCQGDSGGPLVDPNGNVQLGVVSWGRGCALAQYPGVYTSVSYYRRWLDNIRNNN